MSNRARHSWRDVRDHVRGQILNSTYRPGDKLPRDEDIARELDCARSTVHRAMRSLADDGVIERRRKGGTTVNPDPVTRATLDIPITKVEIEARGESYHHHLIETQHCMARPTIAARFGVTEPCPVLRVQALHLAGGRPYVLEDRWISLETVPEAREIDFSHISANEWLVHNRPYDRCDVQIFADDLTSQEAQVMEEKEGAALLVLERTTWTGTAPITHVRAVHARGYRLMSSNQG